MWSVEDGFVRVSTVVDGGGVTGLPGLVREKTRGDRETEQQSKVVSRQTEEVRLPDPNTE